MEQKPKSTSYYARKPVIVTFLNYFLTKDNELKF